MNSLSTFRTRVRTSSRGRRALELIAAQKGSIISVQFTKRTDGTERTMALVFSPAYLDSTSRMNMAAKGLLPVYDLHAGQRKCIPLDAIKAVRTRGQRFVARELMPS
jgi:hypothetical protein